MILEGEALTILPWVGTLLALPLFFIIVYCRDMIKIKLMSQLQRKKGAKLIVGITKDKNIHFDIKKLTQDGKLKTNNEEKEWVHTRQYFCPTLGVQAAFDLQGTKAIYDPIGDQNLDLADGEVTDRMVKRAELMRDIDRKPWDSPEGKLIILVLVVCIITAGLTFATSAQIGEFVEWARPTITALKPAIESIPRAL